MMGCWKKTVLSTGIGAAFRDVPVPEFLEINGVGDNTCPKRCQERKIPVTRYLVQGKGEKYEMQIYVNPFGIAFCRSRPNPAGLYNSFVYKYSIQGKCVLSLNKFGKIF